MKITIIAVGTIKDSYFKLAINEYLKRIQGYSNIEIIEVNESKVTKENVQSEVDICKNKEGEFILSKIKSSDYVVGLDLGAKEYDSVLFSKELNKMFIKGNSKVTFVIGGSYGLGTNIKSRLNESISLSKLTFTHQMTRVILLEALYRCFKISNNESYHK